MKLIPLTKGLFSKVSDHRYEELMQWKWIAQIDTTTGSFYAARASRDENGKKIRLLMHRYIMKPPKNMQCDHINRDTLDNTDENLRICTVSQNQMNRGMNKNNTTGYKGVRRYRDRWKALIVISGKTIYLGIHNTAVEAALAYDKVAFENYGKYAYLNFPEVE